MSLHSQDIYRAEAARGILPRTVSGETIQGFEQYKPGNKAAMVGQSHAEPEHQGDASSTSQGVQTASSEKKHHRHSAKCTKTLKLKNKMDSIKE